MEKIGKRISDLRKKNNLSQKEFGDLIHVSDKTISSWEQNRTEPSLNDLVNISEILNTSITYLLFGNVKKLDIETEIKIKLTEKEFKYVKDIMKTNSKFLKSNEQVDTYYNPIHRSFIENSDINEWLRIGIRGNKKIINYKNWHDNAYCDEFEVEIDDEKNMDKIFNILGIKEICTVNKKRETYLFKDKYEVALDIVEDLGYFIEIEVKKYDSDNPLDEYEKLLKLAKELNLDLNNIDKRGYPYYLIRNKH